MWKIGGEDIRKFPIPVPPLEVQQEIVNMVNDKRKRIAEEIKTAETRQVQALSDVEEMILGVRAVNR